MSCASSAAEVVEKESSLSAWQLKLEESDRGFYRNLNDLKIGFCMPPVLHSCDPMMNQVYERTIFVKIHREFYAVACEILYDVFSRYGVIDWVERLSCGFHSTILFRDKESTLWAFEFLNGINLYDDCCQLELFLAKEPKERSKSQSDATSTDESMGFQELVNPNTISDDESTVEIEVQTSIDLVEIRIQSEFPGTLAKGDLRESCEFFEIETQEIDEDLKGFEIQNEYSVADDLDKLREEDEALDPAVDEDSNVMEGSVQQNEEDFLKLESFRKFPKVLADSFCIVTPEVELEKTKGSCIAKSPDNVSKLGGLVGIRMISFGCLGTSSAQKLFVELPRRDVQVLTGSTEGIVILSAGLGMISRSKGSRSYSIVFDPGGVDGLACALGVGKGINMDVSSDQFVCSSVIGAGLFDLEFIKDDGISMPFDRGRVGAALLATLGALSSTPILIFDPGIVRIDGTLCSGPC